MALIARNAIFERISPIIAQTKRFRGKINVQKPRPPHFERAKFIKLATPWYINPKKDIPSIELCTDLLAVKKTETEYNPFQAIIARELRERFETSRLIAFYHLNPMNADQQYKAYVAFKKENMHYKQYGKKTLELAVKGTKFESVLDFYVSRNMMVLSPEPEIKTLLKISRKFPQLVLLAGIYDDKFLSKDDLVYYSTIPNLQAAQAGLVQTLNGLGSQIVSHLNSHQTTLVGQLQERVKQLEEGGEEK